MATTCTQLAAFAPTASEVWSCAPLKVPANKLLTILMPLTMPIFGLPVGGYCLMTITVHVDAVKAAVAADALRMVIVTVLAAET